MSEVKIIINPRSITYELPLTKLPKSKQQPVMIIEWHDPRDSGDIVTRFQNDNG